MAKPEQQVIEDLVTSSMDEARAIEAYTPRMDFANLQGMGQVGKVYEQIIGEERDHLKEFTETAALPAPLMCREPSLLYEPSPHCVKVLETPPVCYDFRGVRSFVLCKAWEIMQREKRARLPVGEAWAQARQRCVHV